MKTEASVMDFIQLFGLTAWNSAAWVMVIGLAASPTVIVPSFQARKIR